MIDKINGNGSYDLSGSSSKNKRKNPAVRAYESAPGSKDTAHKRTAEIHKKGGASRDQEDAGVILDLSGKAAGKKKAAEAAGRKKDSSWTDTLRKLIHPLVQWLKNFWESDSLKEDAKVPDLPEAGAPAEEGAEGTASEMPSEETMESAATKIPSGETPENAASAMSAGEALESVYDKLAVDESAMALLEGDLPPLDDDGTNAVRVDAARADDLTDERKAIMDTAVRSGNLQQIEQLVTGNGRKRLAHNSDLLTYYDRRGKFVEIDETEKHRVLFGDKHVLKL